MAASRSSLKFGPRRVVFHPNDKRPLLARLGPIVVFGEVVEVLRRGQQVRDRWCRAWVLLSRLKRPKRGHQRTQRKPPRSSFHVGQDLHFRKSVAGVAFLVEAQDVAVKQVKAP